VIAHILATIQNYPPAFEIKRYGLVNDLAVASACRRMGIGQHQVALVKDWFVKKEIRRIEIEVSVANEISTSFWRKMNFKPYKEICYLEL
jgi:ribosomal protein S18 acetylase RimI-like enzyme